MKWVLAAGTIALVATFLMQKQEATKDFLYLLRHLPSLSKWLSK